MTTLVIAGEEAPDYGAEVFRHGRMVGRVTSPSAGRSPTVDRLIAMACIEADLVEIGTRVDVVAARRADGRRGRRQLPDLRPGEEAAAVVSERPIGVLAEGAGGLAVARVIMRRLPAEDVVGAVRQRVRAVRAARRRGVVADRAPRMAAELAGDGIKLLVVASLQAGGGRARADRRRRPACRRSRSTRRWCRPRPARASGRIAAIWADGTLRAQPWLKAHRFQRGGVEVVPLPWAGLAQAIEAGRAPDPATLPDVPAGLHRRAPLPLRGDGRRARSTSRSLRRRSPPSACTGS